MSIAARVLLDQLEQAISDLLTSGVTAWEDGGKKVTLNDLGRLQALRRDLLAECAAGSGSSFRLAAPLR